MTGAVNDAVMGKVRDDAYYEPLNRTVEAYEYTAGPIECGPAYLARQRDRD